MKKNSLVKSMLVFSLSVMMAVGMVPSMTYAETNGESMQEQAVIPKITSISFSMSTVLDEGTESEIKPIESSDSAIELDVTSGSGIKLYATLETNAEDVTYVGINFDGKYDNRRGGSIAFRFSKSDESGKLTASCTVPVGQISGMYYPSYVSISQGDINSTNWNYSDSSALAPIPRILKNWKFNVNGKEEPEEDAPNDSYPELKVTDIRVSQPVIQGPIDVNRKPEEKITVTFQGKPGYSMTSTSIAFINEKYQRIRASWSEWPGKSFGEDGSCTVDLDMNNFDAYTSNGTYRVESVDAFIMNRDTEEYDAYWQAEDQQKDWNALEKPTITIKDNLVDNVPPTLEVLTIDQEEISGGGVLHFTAKISDSVSGTYKVGSLRLQRDGGKAAYIDLIYNEKTGNFEGSAFVSDEAVDGIYHVISVQARDNANNWANYQLGNKNNDIPDDCKKTVTINNGITLKQRDDSTQPSNIIVNDTFGEDYLTFTGVDGVEYEYCYVYEGNGDLGRYWYQVEGTGTERKIDVGNTNIPKDVIRIRAKETDEYAAGKIVKVEDEFTFTKLLKGDFEVSGNAVVGNIITVNANVESGLDEDDELIYQFYIWSDDYPVMYQESTSNKLKIDDAMLGKKILCQVVTKNHSNWYLGDGGKLVGPVNASGSGEENPPEEPDEEPVVEVTADNVAEYLTYKDATLTYNGDNRANDVKDTIKICDGHRDELCFDNFELSFKKHGDNDEYLDDIIDAGIYDVYVSIDAEKIQTKATVLLGSVVIDKHQVTVEDFGIKDTEKTYSRGGWGVDLDYNDYVLDWDHMHFIFKDQNGQPLTEDSTDEYGQPKNVGTYKVYVSYDSDENCTALEEVDTGKTLTINKADAAKEYSFDQYVINYTDTELAGYHMEGYIDDWTLAGKDNQVTATVSCKNPEDEKYVTDLSFGDYTENGELEESKTFKAVKFKLTEESAKLTENKTILLHVDFGNSFTNWTAAFDLPIVITPKKVLWMWIADEDRLVYDGNKKELIFELEGDEGFGAVSGSAVEINEKIEGKNPFTVKITKNEKEVTALKDAGQYIVSAIYDDGTYYGQMTWSGWVEPKRVESLKGLLRLSMDTLVCNGHDQTDVILDAVVIEDGISISKEDYGVYIDCRGPVSAVGTYDVYAFCRWENNEPKNYEWDGDLKVGTVTIGRLSVTADSKGVVTIKVGDKIISNTDQHVALEYYKDNDKLQAAPTAPGTYKVKVSYTDTTYLEESVIAETEYTIPGQTTSGGGSSSGGGFVPSTDDKKDNDNKTESKPVTETKEDGTKVTTTETKAEDGTVQAKVELKNDTTGVQATVNVAKDANGKVTEATAAVTQTSTDKKAGISAATIAQITEAAGTKDVEITTKIVDAKGKTVCKLTVNAKDLKSGNQMKVLKIDSKTGEMSLVNKSTYMVDKDGNLAMDDLSKANYMVLTKAQAEAFSKAVLKTVKVETAKKNVTVGKKTRIILDDGLNMNNVARITYKTSKKSVAIVSKNGTISAKKTGKVTVKAIVTLKNGKTKTVKMTITVKNAKKK